MNFFIIILIIPFYYTGYYNLWNIFMIVLLYFFYQLLNFLSSIDVIWNIICSTMYDSYIGFLVKFWFNLITYINSCSTWMRSHLYNISLGIPVPVIFFIMESPMMEAFFSSFPCILFSPFSNSFEKTVFSFDNRFFCWWFNLLWHSLPSLIFSFFFVVLLKQWSNFENKWLNDF